ncbi:MAG TPA: hypothetical protein DHM44_07465 [Flexistipes sinusarabici]|uniref:PA14 domain-containing protein n=1 Tax=Flexistipes sinusarabici TaxID=2352 RepID=A0A3D5QCC6_FLESI|nr:hypothetical protein [Flexistipes sinusarabici]
MKKLFTIISIFFLGYSLSLAATADNYCATPPFISSMASPLVMLTMGRDHKLYYEAYNDASDINEDGKLDVGYNDNISYYGYFDTNKCYIYDGGSDTYLPNSYNPDGDLSTHYCNFGTETSEWSGNFLNWLSMSRMDVLRKVLYGGYRSTDTSSSTVLEGVYIPQDAHSWGKEYAKDDSAKLTPLPAPTGAECTVPIDPVAWSESGKILRVIYDDDKSGVAGDDHTEIMNSFEPLKYDSYTYLNQINEPNGDNIENGNYIYVTEINVPSSEAGDWEFAIDGDDGVELEIDGVIVASYYGAHNECGCTSHNGVINLSAGKHRIIIRLRERTGQEGATLWFKKPGQTNFSVFSDTNLGTTEIFAPNIDDTCRLKIREFIETGEPAFGGITVEPTNRNLFCITSTSADTPHKIRVLTDKSERIWEWASKERPVCDTSLGTPNDYTVRVKVCDNSSGTGLEENCKEYPAGNYKPEGILQDFGYGGDEKKCSKSMVACSTDSDCGANGGVCKYTAPLYFGLMTGSYENHMSGGVLRKNISAIDDEIDNNTGEFVIPSSGGNIINTINNLKIINFDYSNHDYDCGWMSTPMQEGDCEMWGNPFGEILYESIRYYSGKSSPTSSYVDGISDGDDHGVNLPKPDWGYSGSGVYDVFPKCSKPYVLSISDIYPSYDSELPGSYFDSISTDLDSLDVSDIADSIGSYEGINGGEYFIGRSGNTEDFICSDKTISALGEAMGLCPEEPTKQGTFYSSAIAKYGKDSFKSNFTADAEPTYNINNFEVALSSPIPDIEIDVNGNTVTFVPVGKSVSGSYNIESNCANECTLNFTSDKGLTISNCSSDSYCPSNQIVDFYVETLTPTYKKFRINFEDVEQGADHDMDAIVEYEIKVNDDNTITVKLTSSYAAGSIDQVLGFVASGTTEDGVYLPVKDDDVPNTSDDNTPSEIANMPKVWSKTFTPSALDQSGENLKNPLWYAAKYGGYDSESGEWDKNDDGEPDHYYFVANPAKLEEQLSKAFVDIMKNAASGTALGIAYNTKSTERADGVIQAIFYPEKEFSEAGSYTVRWIGDVFKYSAKRVDKGFEKWKAGEKLSKIDYFNRSPVYTNVNNDATLDDFTASSTIQNMACGSDTTCISEFSDIVDFVIGKDIDGYKNKQINDYGHTWKIGDIVYSTPKVTYDSDNDKNYIFVGSNDGMLHAFDYTTGQELWSFVPSNALPYLKYLKEPGRCHIYVVDGEPYIYEIRKIDNVTGNLTQNVKRKILIGSMGFGGGCVGNGDDTINPPSACSGGQCDGRSSYFALDISDPESPKFLWEFSHNELGFSISGPGVIRRKDPTSGTWNHYVVVGNGPTTYKGYSDNNYSLFFLDLVSGNLLNQYDFGSSTSGSFSGRIYNDGMDVNEDNQTDLMFFGYTDEQPNSSQGGLTAINLLDSKCNTLNFYNDSDCFVKNYLNLAQNPVTARVTSMKCFDDYYIYFGTGRYFYQNDPGGGKASQLNKLYGVPIYNTASNQMYKNIQSLHAVSESDPVACSEIGNPSANKGGWEIELDPANASLGYLRERAYSDPFVAKDYNIVYFLTGIPTGDPCDYGGKANVYARNCATGENVYVGRCSDYTVTPPPRSKILVPTTTSNIYDLPPGVVEDNQTESKELPGLPPPGGGGFIVPDVTGDILLWMER